MNPNGQPNFGSAPPPVGMGGGGGAPVAGSPKDQVNVPAIILMVGAIGGILLNLMGLVQGLVGGGGLGNLPPEVLSNPQMQQYLPLIEGMQKGGPLVSILALGVCGFVVFGALKMRNLQSHGLAMAACIVGIIPCCYSCCCIFTMLGGIWGLVVLMKPDVKAAFTA